MIVIFTSKQILDREELLSFQCQDENEDVSINVIHHTVAALEKNHKVAVLTTCEDKGHELAGSTWVFHLKEGVVIDGNLTNEITKIMREGDVCISIGCSLVEKPFVDVIKEINEDAKLYVCYHVDGGNKLPRTKNVISAFRSSCRYFLDDAFLEIIEHL